MTLTAEQLAQLRKIANNATPGPWVETCGEVTTADYEVEGVTFLDHICNCEIIGTESPNAEFIAAFHPAMALALLDELEQKDKRIAEREAISSAAEKLVRCKGRYHSEQNYRALAALFGVTTPDLPPLESEARTVTVKLPTAYDLTGETDGNCSLNDASMQPDIDGCYFRRRDVESACAAAGINLTVEG